MSEIEALQARVTRLETLVLELAKQRGEDLKAQTEQQNGRPVRLVSPRSRGRRLRKLSRDVLTEGDAPLHPSAGRWDDAWAAWSARHPDSWTVPAVTNKIAAVRTVIWCGHIAAAGCLDAPI